MHHLQRIVLISQLSALFFYRQILWENRKINDIGNDCLVSVDWTDCWIPNQKNAGSLFYTFKFCHAGLRYEIALCILTGHIVWIMGPFPCGDWPDVEVFRFALKQMLDPKERVEADDALVGEDPTNAKIPGSSVHDQDERILRTRGVVRRRHETVNKRMKQFECLGNKYRHDVSFHGVCFRACAVLTQLAFEHGKPMFQVPEYADVPDAAAAPAVPDAVGSEHVPLQTHSVAGFGPALPPLNEDDEMDDL